MSFIIDLSGNAAGIAGLAVELGDLAKQPGATDTLVQIAIGSGTGGSNPGGSIPHVGLWDKNANRIGQFRGDANGHIDEATVKDIYVPNDQNGGKSEQPEYLMLTMNESDGICISMVMASGDGVQWTWLGDMGKACGADWLPSDFKLGAGTYHPNCVWIDQDHSNGIKSQGFSLHMPDFANEQGQVDQYQDDMDTLCKSSKRMTFWYDIVADAEIPFFDSPLEYTDTGADVDISKIVDRDVNLYPHAKKRSVSSRHTRRTDSNNKPGHLVVSNHPEYSAKEVCEHPNSLGPDFVSVVEGTYCDMSTSEWWYLCSKTITDGCFDLDTQKMRGDASGHKTVEGRDTATARVIPGKFYTSSVVWDGSA